MVILPTQLQAAEFQYVYDSLNRLVRVIDSQGNVVDYEYDEIGNILVITRTTVGQLPPPSLTSVTPDVVNQLDTISLNITGSNLLGGQLSTTHPGVMVSGSSGSNTAISGLISVGETAPLGLAPLTVTTPRGADSLTITVLPPLPVITSVFPSHGTAAGGSPITIAGNRFDATTTVMIGGNPATGVQVINARLLTARTPAGTPSPPNVDVMVANSLSGSKTLARVFAYSFPFRTPDALAMLLSGSATLTVTLIEPAAAELLVSLASSNTAVGTVPVSVVIPAGQRVGTVALTPVGEGQTTITVTLGAASRDAILYVGQTDTDGDGLPDAVEPFFGTNPAIPDSDGDTILDGNEDFDNDGLSNAGELTAGTDPFLNDTDGDGLLDGDEVQRGTNPLNPDTDGDGFPDGAEVQAGSNPLLNTDLPANPTKTTGEAVGSSFTVENATNPTGPGPGEAVGSSFTVENATNPTGPGPGEAVGSSFTVENATNPTGPGPGEAVGSSFTVENATNPTGPGPGEAVGPVFSVDNQVGP